MIGCKSLVMAAALALALWLPGVSGAQTVTFDVSLAGVKAGTLVLSGKTDDAAYTARVVIASGGMMRLVRPIRFEGESAGSIRRGRHLPQRYSESADTGQRQSQVEMTYAKGMPQIVSSAPPPDKNVKPVDPDAQRGTLDPATALFVALQDVAPTEACTMAARTFDGRRLAQFTLGGAPASADGLTCEGEYRRLQGFTKAEMEDRQRFAFTATYAPGDDGLLQVVEVSMDTIFGKARVTRR